MMKRILLILLVGLSGSGLFAQQMPEISLFSQNQTVYNPGAIGNQEVLTANFLYRKQWVGFDGSASTQFFCAHAPLKNPKVAIGILLERDGIGITNYTGVYFHYVYRLDLGMNKLAFGLKAGITNASENHIDLRNGASDPAFSENNLNFTLPNFGFGVSYYGQKYWAGLSIPRFLGFKNNGPDKYKIEHDFSKYEYFISGGYSFALNPDFSLDPSVLVILSSRYEQRFSANVIGTYKNSYHVGLGYRTSDDALILLIALSPYRQFSLGYSYDMMMGNTLKFTSGSHEINILYKFGYKVNASNPRVF
jgi:type IX secretion system PorP/SprF family membrane protein